MMKHMLVLVSFILGSQVVLAQDSPLSATPGEPPPPQGWTAAPSDKQGIHLPTKQNKDGYKSKMHRASASPTPVPR